MYVYKDFPGSSAGKESACDAGDPSSIPGSGRSPGEGIGYPLQYSWASLVFQTVKNLPALWETWVWSLDWEELLKKGTATHVSFLAWRIPWTEEPGGLQSMGSQRVRHDLVTFTSLHMPTDGIRHFQEYYYKKLVNKSKIQNMQFTKRRALWIEGYIASGLKKICTIYLLNLFIVDWIILCWLFCNNHGCLFEL